MTGAAKSLFPCPPHDRVAISPAARERCDRRDPRTAAVHLFHTTGEVGGHTRAG
jgi:hypothetical protein